MKKTALLSVLLLLVGLFSWIPKDAMASEGWTTYTSTEYGFTMLVPVGTFFREVEYGNGWGSLHADYDGIQLFAIGKLGRKESAAEIEKYGVKVTGVPHQNWRKIDEGSNSNGWTWYRTVEANHRGKILFGGYGVGSRGSYMLVLQTTSEDFEYNKADYMKWYESARLLK